MNNNRDGEIEFLWSDFKAELYELLLATIGDYGITIYEWRYALDAVLSVLQLKERQYRRIPRELLEQFVNYLFPTNVMGGGGGGIGGGRSLLRFLVSELQRLKGNNSYNQYGQYGSSGQRVDYDEKKEGEGSVTTAADQGTDQRDEMVRRAAKVILYTVSELAERRFIPLPRLRMMDDSIAEVEQERQLTTVEQDKIEKSEDIENKEESTELEEAPEDEKKKLEQQSYLDVLPDEIREMLSWSNSVVHDMMHPHQGTGSLVHPQHNLIDLDQTSGTIPPGRLSVRVPLYRNPKKRLEELKNTIQNRQDDLQRRLDSVNQMEKEFFGSDDGRATKEEIKKKRLSYLIAVNCLRKRKEMLRERKKQDRIQRLSIRQEYEKQLQKQLTTNLQFVNLASVESNQTITRDDKIFKVVCNAIDSIDTNEVDAERLKKLVRYVVDKKITHNSGLTTEELIEYKMNRIEEYCYYKLLFSNEQRDQISAEYVLDFIKRLRDTIQYERIMPTTEQELRQREEYAKQINDQEQIMLRRGAYFYLQTAIKDKYGVDVDIVNYNPYLDQDSQSMLKSDAVSTAMSQMLKNSDSETQQIKDHQRELQMQTSRRMFQDAFLIDSSNESQRDNAVSSDDTYSLLTRQLEFEKQMQTEELRLFGQRNLPNRTQEWLIRQRADLTSSLFE